MTMTIGYPGEQSVEEVKKEWAQESANNEKE
jgi:hypothetical protein